MYKGIIKSALSYCSIALLSVILSGCGKSSSEDATILLRQAEEALESKNYEVVILLTDSLKSAYPKEIDLRREALHLSTRAVEGLTLIKLQEADSLSALFQAKGDSLSRYIKYVPNPIEGYYVASTADPVSFIGTDGIQARITPDGDFYLVSSLGSRKINSTSLSVTDGVSSATTSTVNFDGERNDRSMGAEVITFITAECDSVGMYIFTHRNAPLKLTFNGKSSYTLTLNKKQIDEIASVYDYATTIRNFKLASIEKEKQTKALEIGRSQAARTFVEKEGEKN